MKDDSISWNFFHAVENIIASKKSYVPDLERNLDNPDPQVVFGCTFILAKTSGYLGNPTFYKLLIKNLRHDDCCYPNLYLFNAYEAALWLNAHYDLAKSFIHSAMDTNDLQQLMFLALITHNNEPTHNFQQNFAKERILEISKNLNSDDIYLNATYATVILILIGKYFGNTLHELESIVNFDNQGKRLLKFIRGKVQRNDTTLISTEFTKNELASQFMNWENDTILSLNEQDINRPSTSPF